MADIFDRFDTPVASMHEAMRHWARTTPDAPALWSDGREPLSYRDLLARVDGIGERLNALGVGRHDRIAVLHPGGADMAAAVMGVWSRATAAPLNPSYTVGEFAGYLRDLRVRAVAVAEDMDTPARAAADRLGLPVFDIVATDANGAGAMTLKGAAVGPVVDTGVAAGDDLALLLTTSGTTSQSKIVPIRHSELLARCRNAGNRLELTPADRSLNLMPLYHSHGLNSGLGVSIVSGGSVMPMPQFDVERFFRDFDDIRPTWFTAVFTFHHQIHAHAPAHRDVIARSALRLIHTSSGRLEPRIADDLETWFGVPMVGTYATTETGVIAGDSLPPAPRKRASVGTPACDEVAVVGEDGRPVPNGERGEVCVRGANVFKGYEGSGVTTDFTADGWFRTGDEGMFDADGFLFLTGRVKETINRGGEKISPSEVDAAILRHPAVATAATFAIPHATLGQEAAAAVVLNRGAALGEKELGDFLRRELTPFKVPRRILMVDDIPKGPTGKIQRHALAAAFGLDRNDAPAATVEPEDDRPPTPLERQLQDLWAGALRRPQVGLHEDFFLLGGDSLQAIELFLQIEKTLGRRLPRAVLFEASTVAEMARHIETTQPFRCVVPIQPAGSRPAFFCVHDRHGHALNFRALARHLGPDQPFYGIQCVGLDGIETPLARIEDMAARYLNEMRRIQPEGPYFLGGYSLGGLVAYEMARLLRNAGETVGLLALFDTFPRVRRRRRILAAWFGYRGNRLGDTRLPSVVRYVTQGVRNIIWRIYDNSRQRCFGASWRLCEFLLPTMPKPLRKPGAAMLLAIRSYRATPSDGDAVLFTAVPFGRDHDHMAEDWRSLLRGNLVVEPVSGHHDEMMDEPHVRDLARKLSAHLDNTVRRPATVAAAD